MGNKRKINVMIGEEIASLISGEYLNSYSGSHLKFYHILAKKDIAVQYNFTMLGLIWLIENSKNVGVDERNVATRGIGVLLAAEFHTEELVFQKMEFQVRRSILEVDVHNDAEVANMIAAFVSTPNIDMDSFMMYMKKEHRTLIQNFCRFYMKWIEYVCKQDIQSSVLQIAGRIDEHNKSFPYI